MFGVSVIFINKPHNGRSMSFFNDTKNAGLLLLIIAVVELIAAAIIAFVIDGGVAESTKKILIMVGAVVAALIEVLLGLDIMRGKCRMNIMGLFGDVTTKFGVLVALNAGMGLANLVAGIFYTVALGAGGVSGIVLGLIMLIFAYLMVNGGSSSKKVIWIILLVVYILGLIFSIMAAFVLIGIPDLLMYIMLLTFVLSSEVKSKMDV